MTCGDSGGISKRVIAIQLVLVAGLVAFLKFYLPRMEKSQAAANLDMRESRIEDFFQSTTVEDSGRTVESAGGGQVHPKRLRSIPSIKDVEQALGAPDSSTTDYAGGLHLTWIGTRHSLEGSFDRGRLYSLSFTDRRNGHGESVFESSANWRSF